MFSTNRLCTAAVAVLLATTTSAHAADAAGSGFTQIIPLILITIVFWFLLIRPQQKRLKEHRGMVDALKKGDKVVTNSGIFGKITDIKEEIIHIEIADGVRVKMQRDAISSVND